MKISEIISRALGAIGRAFDAPKVEITINYAPSVPAIKLRRVAGANTIHVQIDFDDRNPRAIDAKLSEHVASAIASTSRH